MLSAGVIVPAYNEEKSIEKTIDSIIQQDYPVDQIIVVNDCSTDRTEEIASSYEEVQVITTEANQGSKAMAQNYAISLVETEIVITIDGDTFLAPDAVGNILKAFEKDSDLFSACGFVIPQKIESVWERGRYAEYCFGITLNKNIQVTYNAMLVCSGCFSAFNTEKLREFKGFKDRTMAEDMDLTWEVLIAGKRNTYVSNAICYPLEPGDFKTYCSQVSRWYRSFFQNIAVHKKAILKFEKPMLSIFILFSLLEGLLFPSTLFFLGTYLSIEALLTFALFDLLVVTIPALIKGIKLKKTKLTLLSIPCYVFVTRWLNLVLFLIAFFKEWIMRDTLVVWEKGH